MTLPESQKPLYIFGRSKEDVLGTLLRSSWGSFPISDQRGIVFGSRGRAALWNGTYLGFGVDPSPIAQKAVDWFISRYRGDPLPKKRIFYVCYAGTHTSVLSAWAHLGAFDGESEKGFRHSEDSIESVVGLPAFDQRTAQDIGIPTLVGEDLYGTEIYAFGSGWHSRNLELMLCDLIELLNARALACFVSVRGVLDFPARVGGFLSRRLHVVFLGRKIIAASLSRKIPLIKGIASTCLDLSRRWNHNENKPHGEVLWVDGKKQGWIDKSSKT